jgi:hypothetical protein
MCSKFPFELSESKGGELLTLLTGLFFCSLFHMVLGFNKIQILTLLKHICINESWIQFIQIRSFQFSQSLLTIQIFF